jgi:hypothetical protein
MMTGHTTHGQSAPKPPFPRQNQGADVRPRKGGQNATDPAFRACAKFTGGGEGEGGHCPPPNLRGRRGLPGATDLLPQVSAINPTYTPDPERTDTPSRVSGTRTLGPHQSPCAADLPKPVSANSPGATDLRQQVSAFNPASTPAPKHTDTSTSATSTRPGHAALRPAHPPYVKSWLSAWIDRHRLYP